MTTYLDRALQSANTARKAYGDADYNAACNRAYYAVFYAAEDAADAIAAMDKVIEFAKHRLTAPKGEQPDG